MTVLIIVLFNIAIAVGADTGYHETLDNNFDFNSVTLREFIDMANCLIDRGPCTDFTRSIRIHYPEVIEEACARCYPEQKRVIRVFFGRAKKETPEIYEAFKNYYDPERKYFDKFEASVSNY